MERLPLLEFPIDILFLILYELPVEDLLNLASVPFIDALQPTPALNHPLSDLQGFPLHL